MIIKSHELFSAAAPQNPLSKVLSFPLTRIVTMLLFMLPVLVFHIAAGKLIEFAPEVISKWLNYIEAITMIILFTIAYRLYTRHIEKREAQEFSREGAIKEFGGGILLGGALITSVVIILLTLGYIKFSGINSPFILFSGFIMFGVSAFIEELIFRLILFRLFEEFLGSWISLILVAFLFGAAHLVNDNANFYNTAAIALEAGILVAAAFMLTRRIWLIFGLHLGWNYFQSAVFGITVSGEKAEGFLVPEISGPETLTGGIFGIEASILTVIICLAVGIIILRKAIASGQLVKPSWARKRALPDSNPIIS